MKIFTSKYIFVIAVAAAFLIIIASIIGLVIVNNANKSQDYNFIQGEIKNFTIDLSVKDPTTSQTKSYTLTGTPGENVLSFMKDLQDQDSTFIFTYTQSQYGTFIDSINGYTPNIDKKEFWKLFVNDQVYQGEPSDYVLKAGDKLRWEIDIVQE